jgi:hypothetical protein
MRRSRTVAFTTSSLANSMPVVRRFILRQASRVSARSPQWKSETGERKSLRPTAESSGLPIQRWFQGMAPGRMRPLKRDPITSS